MFFAGPLELLIIAAILFLFVGVPIVAVVVVLVVVNRSKSSTHDDAGSEKSDAETDVRR